MYDKKSKELRREAKMGVLKDLQNTAKGMMKEGLGSSLKKVSVMAPDKEHLEQGLDKAKELVGSMPEGSPQEEASESSEEAMMEKMHPEMEAMEDEESPKSLEEVDAKIKELEELKKQLLARK